MSETKKGLVRADIEAVVRFAMFDPKAMRSDGDTLFAIVDRFHNMENRQLGDAVNHMLRMLRTYVALDAAERCTPKAEQVTRRRRRAARRTEQHDLFNGGKKR
jgi:hypothetical protein